MNWLLDRAQDWIALFGVFSFLGGTIWYVLWLKIKDRLHDKYITKDALDEELNNQFKLFNVQLDFMNKQFKAVGKQIDSLKDEFKMIIAEAIK